jgi:deazaflavin-dependent oxidoreductase (nitroreductase family)
VTAGRRRLTSVGNKIGVWTYRVSNGRAGGGAHKVLLMTVPGRRTGLPRSTCMRYLEHEGGYVVWGTASGATRDPDWFRNLRASETATIELGRTSRTVHRRELTGEERDRVWTDVVLARVPGVARYERKARRTIPVAVLTPEPGDAD